MKLKRGILILLTTITLGASISLVPVGDNTTAEATSRPYQTWTTIKGNCCPNPTRSGTLSNGETYFLYLIDYYYSNGYTHAYYSGYYYY
ncbi:hypothetical protein [Candidatus Enterococcus clewellii]|uniref:Secreted protein n=1 Tax=Candidatus Enterococcus clewellii TaxID=1834193 RepID=A0AAQ3VS82_9ENTE